MNAIATRSRATLATSASIEGVGLQSGRRCCLKLIPLNNCSTSLHALPISDEPTLNGIVFQRIDLPHKPKIPAALHLRDFKSYRTTNLICKGERVGTVEHLMAACSITGIDDLLIELEGPEVPIVDGSAAPFIELIENCGLQPSIGSRSIWSPSHPIAHRDGATQMIAIPAQKRGVSCLIHYPQSPLIGCQYFSSELDKTIGAAQIAPSRTFCLLQEAKSMQAQGFMLGGDLKNALVIDQNRVLTKGGLRFQDEMVRHKILDLIGDLALLDFDLNAHITAICPSHETTAAFAAALAQQYQRSL